MWKFLPFLSLVVAVAHGAEIRYDDVLYLDEWKQPPLRLKTLNRAPITFSRDPRSVIAYLAPGQLLTVIGVGEKQHYVSAQIPTGRALGWVESDSLEAPPEKLVAEMRTRRERMLAHRELIARHEVVLGMNREEVRESLGKPDRKRRVRSIGNEEEEWMYIIYRYLPFYHHYYDENGVLRQVVSYRREPAGHKVIVLRNGEVVAIEEEVEQKRRQTPAIIPPPARRIHP